MRLLLDTHVLLAIFNERKDALDDVVRNAVGRPTSELLVSVVSLWEIAIRSASGSWRSRRRSTSYLA